MLVTKALSQDVTNLAFVPLASEAAHRTPPGKRPVGTEINHTLW
ncbi:hypothetical protein [Lysinibacillus sp. RS5]